MCTMATLDKLREVNAQIERDEKTQAARKEREVFLLLNALTDMVVVYDTDGIIKYANPSTFRILGYDPEHLVGENICAVFNCEDILDETNVTITTFGRNNTGTKVPVRMYIGELQDSAVNYYIAVIQKVNDDNDTEQPTSRTSGGKLG